MKHPLENADQATPPRPYGVHVVLTRAAARHADDHDLRELLEALAARSNVAVGDGLAVSRQGHRHVFAVIKRVWAEGSESAVLEITLDWPARV